MTGSSFDSYGALKVVRGLGGANAVYPMDSPAQDSFGRTRISTPDAIAAFQFDFNLMPYFWWQITGTGGTVTHDGNKRSAILTATSSSGSKAILSQKGYNYYQKGRSLLVKMTFVLGAAATNVRRRVGYFDKSNGIFLEQTSSGLSVVKRSSVSGSVLDIPIAQADWSQDHMDGSGDRITNPSGINLSQLNQQILWIDLQHLGAGRVRMGFDIAGQLYEVHRFLHANASSNAPYMQSATLPMRYECESTGASAGATMQCICAEVESEGGNTNPNGLHFSAFNTSDISCNTSDTLLIAVRAKATFNSIVNRIIPIIDDASVLAGTNPVQVSILYGPTLTGGAWTSADSESGIEYNTTCTHTGGTIVDSFPVASASGATRQVGGSSVSSDYPICLDEDGANPIALAVVARSTTGTSNCRAHLNWHELR